MNDNLKLEACPYCRYSIGDWVFRSHLVSCSKNPWTYITADPTTLPENSQKVLATVRLLRALNKDDDLDVMPAYAADGFWYTYDRKLLAKPDYEVIAWEPWPEPAPLPGETADKTK